MKKFHAGLLCAAVLSLSSALGAQEFEGVVTMRVSGRGGDGGAPAGTEVQYLAKKGKLRIEMGGRGAGGMAMIADPAEKKMYMLMAAQSMYSEMSMADAAKEVAGVAPKVTRTGRSETVAGYSCEHVEIVTQQNSADVCLAKGLGTFMALNAIAGRGNMEPWQRALMAEGGFPMKVVQNGQTLMEVTKVEKKALSEALFTVPDNYSRMEMPRRP